MSNAGSIRMRPHCAQRLLACVSHFSRTRARAYQFENAQRRNTRVPASFGINRKDFARK